MCQNTFTIEQPCVGVSNYSKYGLLFDSRKMNILDGSGKVIGIISNNYLRSVDCTKTRSKRKGDEICVKCSAMVTKLNENLKKVKNIIKNTRKLPSYSSIISYPHVMYQLLCKTSKYFEMNEFELKILESLRKAKSTYDEESNLKKKILLIEENDKIQNELNNCEKSLPENNTNCENPTSRNNSKKKAKKTNRFTHVPPASENPLNKNSLVKFEDTFFMKFLENQLENYSRPPNGHKYDEVMKRFWFLAKYFSGKQFFNQLSGKKNQNIPSNWRTNLQYNMIMPSNNTLKNWIPKGSIGFCEYSKFVFDSLKLDSCKQVCITIDGMKVLKKLEYMSGNVVGTSQKIDMKNLPSNENVNLSELTEEMLFFNVNAIDNTWHCPLGWFSVSSTDKINDFIYKKMIECNEKLKNHSLKLVCACADGEVDAKGLQIALRPIIDSNFIFVNDYVHNFKNQRNCLFNGTILKNISMSTLINLINQFPEIYELLDKEEVTPSDIMAIDPCLELTSNKVIEKLKSLRNNDAAILAKYLEIIREVYDVINENDTDIIEKLELCKQYFKDIPAKEYPDKTRSICLHTIEGFQFLAEKYSTNFRPSCITTNYNELFFSIIRKRYPRATAKQFCSSALIASFIFLMVFSSDEVRGFSLPETEWTQHYRGMKLKIKSLPELKFTQVTKSDLSQNQIDDLEKWLKKVNHNIEGYVRKSTLRMETCAPKKLFLCCPIDGCNRQKPYIVKGQFKNHLLSKHSDKITSEEQAKALVRQLECKHFDLQYQADYLERKRNAKRNKEEKAMGEELSNFNGSQDTMSTVTQVSKSLNIDSLSYENTDSSVTFQNDNLNSICSPKYLVSKYLTETEIHTNITNNHIIESAVYKKNNQQYHIVLLDLETTGTNANTNEIVQVGMISTISKCAFSIYIKPRPHNWSSFARNMHSGKMTEINNGKPLDQIIYPIHNYLTKNNSCTAVILVHSTGLDQSFLLKALTRHNLPTENYMFVHTLSKEFFPRKKLEKLFENISKPMQTTTKETIDTAHDAAFDTAMLYDIICHKFGDNIDALLDKCFMYVERANGGKRKRDEETTIKKKTKSNPDSTGLSQTLSQNIQFVMTTFNKRKQEDQQEKSNYVIDEGCVVVSQCCTGL